MKWKQIDAARYDEMLNVLPPAAFEPDGFLVGEPWDHTRLGCPRFAAFLRVEGRHYEAEAPMTVNEFRRLIAANRSEVVRDVEGQP